MLLVEVQNVKKNYSLGWTLIPALKGVDLKIDSGEFLSIVGPSGCGKTTLLNIIGCIDKPTEGNVFFETQNVAEFSDDQEADTRLAKIGFIFQSFNLVPVLNIVENIELPMILKKVPKSERRERVMDLIKTVGLEPYIDHKPDELSGGQRQRVAIARALANSPKLVIADEPTANLDSKTGEEIVNAMRELNERHKVTFIFSTHNPAVMKYAKRIINLKDGLVENIEVRGA